jgi:putative membrane protein
MYYRVLRFVVPVLVVAGFAFGSMAAANESRGSHHRVNSDQRQTSREGSSNKGLSAWDEEWLMMSIQGDRFEIAGGQLAQQKGSTAIVRALGARLASDHTKSLKDAVDEAKEYGIQVPDSPSPSQQWELRVVSTFSGKAFDRWYSDLEVQDHRQDIQETQDEIDKGTNPDIKQLAKDDLPMLQEHLKLAEQALAASQ